MSHLLSGGGLVDVFGGPVVIRGVKFFENGHFRPIFFLTPDLDSSRPCGSRQLCFTFQLSKSKEKKGGTHGGKIQLY